MTIRVLRGGYCRVLAATAVSLLVCSPAPAQDNNTYRIRPGKHLDFAATPRVDLSRGGTIEIWFQPEWPGNTFAYSPDTALVLERGKPRRKEGKDETKEITTPAESHVWSPLLVLGGPDDVGLVLWVDPRYGAVTGAGSYIGVSRSIETAGLPEGRIELRAGKRLTPSKWHHLVLVNEIEAGYLDLYFDGEKQDAIPGAFTRTGGTQIRFGWQHGPATLSLVTTPGGGADKGAADKGAEGKNGGFFAPDPPSTSNPSAATASTIVTQRKPLDATLGAVRIYREPLSAASVKVLQRFGLNGDDTVLPFLTEAGALLGQVRMDGRLWNPAEVRWEEGYGPMLDLRDPLEGQWVLAGAGVTIDKAAESMCRVQFPPVFTFLPSSRDVAGACEEYQVYADARPVGTLKRVDATGNQWRFHYFTNTKDGGTKAGTAEFRFARLESDSRPHWQLTCANAPGDLRGLGGSTTTDVKWVRPAVATDDLTYVSKLEDVAKNEMSNSFLFGNTVNFWTLMFRGFNRARMDPTDLMETGLQMRSSEFRVNGEEVIFAAPGRYGLGGHFRADTNEKALVPFGLVMDSIGFGQLDKDSIIAADAAQVDEATTARVGVPMISVSLTGEVSPIGAITRSWMDRTVSKASSEQTTVITTARQIKHMLRHDDEVLRITPEFRDAVLRLQCGLAATADVEARRRLVYSFFETWGTHYAEAIAYGGYGWWQKTINRHDFSEADTRKDEFEVAIGEAKTGVGTESTNEVTSSLTLEQEQAFTRGAQASPDAAGYQSIAVDDKPYPIGIDMAPIADLLSPRYFPDHPDVFGKVHEFVAASLDSYYEWCAAEIVRAKLDGGGSDFQGNLEIAQDLARIGAARGKRSNAKAEQPPDTVVQVRIKELNVEPVPKPFAGSATITATDWKNLGEVLALSARATKMAREKLPNPMLSLEEWLFRTAAGDAGKDKGEDKGSKLEVLPFPDGGKVPAQVVFYPTHPLGAFDPIELFRGSGLEPEHQLDYDLSSTRLVNALHCTRELAVAFEGVLDAQLPAGGVYSKKWKEAVTTVEVPEANGLTWVVRGSVKDQAAIGVFLDVGRDFELLVCREVSGVPYLGVNKTSAGTMIRLSPYQTKDWTEFPFPVACDEAGTRKWAERELRVVLLGKKLSSGEAGAGRELMTPEQIRAALVPPRDPRAVVRGDWNSMDHTLKSIGDLEAKGIKPDELVGMFVTIKLQYRADPNPQQDLARRLSQMGAKAGLVSSENIRPATELADTTKAEAAPGLASPRAWLPANAGENVVYSGVMNLPTDPALRARMPEGAIAYFPFDEDGTEVTGLSRPLTRLPAGRFKDHGMIRAGQGFDPVSEPIEVLPRSGASFTIHMDFTAGDAAGGANTLISRADGRMAITCARNGLIGFRWGPSDADPPQRLLLDGRHAWRKESWQKLICAVDGPQRTFRMCLNGVMWEQKLEDLPVDLGLDVGTNPRWKLTGDTTLDGYVDELVFFGRALSETEIRALAGRDRLAPGQQAQDVPVLGPFSYLYVGDYKSTKDFSGTPAGRDLDYSLFSRPFAAPEFEAAHALTGQRSGYGLLWSGRLDVPQSGEYRFFLESSNGSTLSLDGKVVADNDGLHDRKTVASAPVHLQAGMHPIRLTWFTPARSRLDFLSLEWEGADLLRSPVVKRVYRLPQDQVSVQPVPNVAGRWRWLVGSGLDYPFRGGLLEIHQVGNRLAIEQLLTPLQNKFVHGGGFITTDGTLSLDAEWFREMGAGGEPITKKQSYRTYLEVDQNRIRVAAKVAQVELDARWERIPEGEVLPPDQPPLAVLAMDYLDTVHHFPDGTVSVWAVQPGQGFQGVMVPGKEVVFEIPGIGHDIPKQDGKREPTVAVRLTTRAVLAQDGRSITMINDGRDNRGLTFGRYWGDSTVPIVLEARDASGRVLEVAHVILDDLQLPKGNSELRQGLWRGSNGLEVKISRTSTGTGAPWVYAVQVRMPGKEWKAVHKFQILGDFVEVVYFGDQGQPIALQGKVGGEYSGVGGAMSKWFGFSKVLWGNGSFWSFVE